ncbi:RidA family protein [Aquabacter sp. L1I39]|uniref:RidA family protein n=1 Tax=Aquabacter sp. L1I39 TaxID=2820278 RepID=UPI001ADA3F17|nr:RidA family protein [Aquabacter sp. L1I39]QTL05697.1 RidA family protein [Aquabacter sp. L1I39]
MHEILQPEGWAKPIGYANGILARGRQIWVGGQIGWSAHQTFETDDLVEQVRQTLLNIVAVLEEGGAEPHHIVSMTWYMVDKQEYLARLKEIGAVYREVIGRHFPAMAAVQVLALMEDRAKVEIQATAVVPE